MMNEGDRNGDSPIPQPPQKAKNMQLSNISI